ncbi:MAG: beta-lactamase family protein [Bacteroidia bacterium]|nr:beta-lactamase family protein [Bacteroidia bacterium]
MKLKSLLLLHCRILVMLLVFPALVIAQPDDLEKKVDEITSHWKSDGPGGVVGIVDKGELIFSKAYGMASLEYEVPNTTETIFNIASVSKQFTAYAIVLLEQEGKLSIDDDIRKYLPEVPDFGNTITIRHLLNHISGLRNFQNLLAMAGWRTGDSMTNDDLLRFISYQKELNFPVGSEYLYCNTGFVLATYIVERVTGQDFKDWTQENIFDPLGMNNTSYREDMTIVHQNTATSYNLQDDGHFIQPKAFWTYMGNGNIYTTIGDLAKWSHNFNTGKLGGKQGIQRLTERGILTSGDTLNYALGIGVREYRGQPIFAHGGSIGGYRAGLTYFPDQDVGFIVITNFSSANAGGVNRKVMDQYLEEHLEPAAPNPLSRIKHLNEAASIDPSAFEAVVGNYLVDGLEVKIYSEDGKMMLHAPGETPVLELTAASDSSYFVADAALTVYILKSRSKDPDRIVGLRGDERFSGVKMDMNAQKPAELDKLVGAYYSPELDTEYQMSVKDGKLFIHHQRHGTMKAYVISRSQIVSEAFPIRDIKVVRWQNGEVHGIKVSNGRVRNLWMEKK